MVAGSQCSHFTAENATDQTRISLDFRVIIDRYWIPDHDQFTSTPGAIGELSNYLTDPDYNYTTTPDCLLPNAFVLQDIILYARGRKRRNNGVCRDPCQSQIGE